MREKTPGGSFPSPSAALNPSCWRARASLASARKERGSVIDRSHRTRLFSWTLLCEGQTHVFNRCRARTVINQKHACALTFSRLWTSAGYFMWCSLEAAAMREIHSCGTDRSWVIDSCDAHASERKVCVLYLSHISSFGFSRLAGVNERSADCAHRQTVAAVLPAAEMLK